MSAKFNIDEKVTTQLEELENDENEPKTVRRRASTLLAFFRENTTLPKFAKLFDIRQVSLYTWAKNLFKKGIAGIKNRSGRKSKEIYLDVQNSQNETIEQEKNLSVSCEEHDTLNSDTFVSEHNQKNNIDNSAEYNNNSIDLPSPVKNSPALAEGTDGSQDNGLALMNSSNTNNNTKILVSIVLKNGEQIIEKKVMMENTLPYIDAIDYTNKDTFASSVQKVYYAIYNAVISTANQSIISYVNASMPEDKDAKKSYFCEVGSYTGNLSIQIPHSLRVQLATNERIYEPLFYGKIVTLGCITSIREAADIINDFSMNNDMKYRTLGDLIKKEGKKITEQTKQDTTKILKTFGFDPDTGELVDESKIDKEVTNPQIPNDKDELMFEKTLEGVEDYNENKKYSSDKIDCDNCQNSQEKHPDYTVVISADFVDVWKQKDQRKSNTYKDNKENNIDDQQINDKSQKGRKRVRQATVHVTTKEGTRVFVAETIVTALLNTLAYLLKWGFLKNRQLIFFTDGAKDVNNAIKKVFKFRPFKINLDWFHLVKKCYEFLSMALYGGKINKENNQKIRSILSQKLFVGHVDDAKKYLDSISNKSLKDKSKLQELKDYLDRRQEYIYCYAIRKALHLLNSSNLAETFNNLCVSLRCKSEGKSWSQEGINAIANIRSLRINKETNWFANREFNYAPVPHKKNTIEKLNKLNEVDGILASA